MLVAVSIADAYFAFLGASLVVVDLATTGGVSGIGSGAGGGVGALNEHISTSPFVSCTFRLNVKRQTFDLICRIYLSHYL